MSGRLVVLAALILTGASAAGRTPAPASPSTRSNAEGQAAKRGPTVFSCRLRDGKMATVTGGGKQFVYRYGTERRPELAIVGTPANGNLFKRVEVHGGDWDIQLRFVSGEYSYIVHSFPRNEIVDNTPTSGLKVFRAGKRILDRDCSPWAAISVEDSEDLFALPDIPEGAPSAWGE